MRLSLSLSLVLLAAPLSLLVAPPLAHSSGEVPTVTYSTKRESCGASAAYLQVKAPPGAAVSGTIVQVGSSAPPTPFSVAANETKRVSVKGNPLECSTTSISGRTYRVTTVGAAPFDLVLAPRIVELGPTATSGGGQSKAKIALRRASASCETGTIEGEVEVTTGAEPPSPVLVETKAGEGVAATPLTMPANSSKRALVQWKTTPTVCSAATVLSVGIHSPSQAITLGPIAVSFAKAN